MSFWPSQYESDSDEKVMLKKFGEIGALPLEELGRIGASVGYMGALAVNNSERLEPMFLGEIGALDSERLEYP